MTQDEEAFVQYKSHQAHRREQEATGKKRERTTEGFYEEEKGERPRLILEPTETEKDAINVTKIEQMFLISSLNYCTSIYCVLVAE